jgi:hypothetical protein
MISNHVSEDALIGWSGFVGSTLLRQRHFGHSFRATDIQDICGHSFHTVVCAGAPAQKWLANKEPEVDCLNIEKLTQHLESVRCEQFVLISTVDVFKEPVGVDEQTPIEEQGLHAYGANRHRLEAFVQHRFANHLVVRLPGLVGPGLRKNIIFDLLNDNNVHAVDSRSRFQFYPMVNLWYDVDIALAAGLRLIHLTAEPLSVAEVAALGFGKPHAQILRGPPVTYDMRTCHASLFGATGNYQYSGRESLQAVRAYAQSEQRSSRAQWSEAR